jgi:hypothetical protein
MLHFLSCYNFPFAKRTVRVAEIEPIVFFMPQFAESECIRTTREISHDNAERQKFHALPELPPSDQP